MNFLRYCLEVKEIAEKRFRKRADGSIVETGKTLQPAENPSPEDKEEVKSKRCAFRKRVMDFFNF